MYASGIHVASVVKLDLYFPRVDSPVSGRVMGHDGMNDVQTKEQTQSEGKHS